MEALEPLVRISDGKFSTGDSARWLTDPSPEVACIYDVDLNAVDPASPWIKVRRTIVPRPNQYHGLGMLRVIHAMTQHPSLRTGVKGINVASFRSLEDLPEWLRGRIAVLNIADADDWIKGVGKRWTLNEYAKSQNWARSLNGRYYTIELNCEECV